MFSASLPRPTRYRLFACLLLLAGLLLTGAGVFPASAQQPDSAEVGPEGIPHTDSTAERKSPALAVLYSAGGSALLTPLFGPSVGHFYAGDAEQAWRGIRLRLGGFGVAGGFLVLHVIQVHGDGNGWGADAAEVTVNLIAIQALYDIITAWHSAKEFNESHDLRAQVAPTVGSQGKQAGLSVRVSF